jgi:hypothetical protein
MGICVELVALKPVMNGKVAESAGKRIEATKTIVCTYPQPSE